MATFVKLTSTARQQPIWVNVDLVREMHRQPAVDDDLYGKAPERTTLSFDSTGYGDHWDTTDVAETPEDIAHLAAGGAL